MTARPSTELSPFGARLIAAYRILHPGRPVRRGPQRWFRLVMGQQLHQYPAKATVSRWVSGDRAPWPQAWTVLDRLEADARLVLQNSMRTLER